MGGYWGNIIRVNLTTGEISRESKDENFYRTYYGGAGMTSYFLLNELKQGIDPLGPDNKLVFAPGVITGAPFAGSARNAVGAKSPLTGGFGKSEVGGFWGADLKRAGVDALIIEGCAREPVYLWINDGSVEIRSAHHLWGRQVKETHNIMKTELQDTRIRTALIGPAGENKVLFACIINDMKHAAGRTGMGAVMGSKNLKGIAVRGTKKVSVNNLDEFTRVA
ncbi:MAG: hypothetical protein KGZ79_04560 [Dethiobacter sp.]|jgi:aldehyde:ferredoxin oxidoreductase|nr:hypothetical protein [Dethiobacter sp.]